MGEKTIYDLELHENFQVSGLDITRVPGGWIYRYWDFEKKDYYSDSTFVPYSIEFDIRKPDTTPIPSSGNSGSRP